MVKSSFIQRPRRSPARRIAPAALLALLFSASSAAPVAADLDAVFVLDTTGSMGGEIQEVQERVRELADSLGRARAGERIRFGIVAYRDRGDEYVTRLSSITEDMEATRRFLASLSANGGGDGPESVVAALAAALEGMSWDPSSDTDRQIFLVGDAPPHLDYPGEATPEALIETALRERIVINTIGCRSLPSQGIEFFRRLAYATEGSYQHIGRLQVAEPGALTEAMSRAAASGEDSVPDEGEEVRATWLRHEPREDVTGILVRQGGPRGSEQDRDGDALLPCTLEVRMPRGLGFGREPHVQLSSRGLEVGLELAGGEGGIDLFELETCPALSTPIHVTLGGR
jgi:Mg-chelatase subunit ChlD